MSENFKIQLLIIKGSAIHAGQEWVDSAGCVEDCTDILALIPKGYDGS